MPRPTCRSTGAYHANESLSDLQRQMRNRVQVLREGAWRRDSS